MRPAMKPEATPRKAQASMPADFRGYLQILREHDELREISWPVDLRDVAALVAQSDKALFFSRVIGYSIPVVSGLLQSRARLALAMEVDYEKIEAKLRRAMDHPVAPESVESGSVKDVIITGNDVDLYRLPVPIFSLLDGGPMITGAVVIAEDPEYAVLADTIYQALTESNRFFAEILTLFPDSPFDRVARAIGMLHENGKIAQDKDGKYQITRP
jgi:2,5-furandicarboxylate decarboxylase 1